MRSDTARVHGALALVSVIYGYFYVAAKLLLHVLQPAQFLLLRFVLTALVVGILQPLLAPQRLPKGRDLWKVMGWGLTGVFLVQILVVWGLHQTTAFHSALIMATIPIMTLGLSILMGRETYHLQKLIGIIIGFAGVSVLLLLSHNPGTPLPSTYLQGDFIVLLNAAGFSWFLLGSQKMLETYSPFAFMSYCYIVSALLFALLFGGENLLAGQGLGLDFLKLLTTGQWLMIAYVIIFASIVSYTLNNYALRRVNPSVVAIYIFIQPVVSAVTGYYLLGEHFTLPMGLATVITFAGVLLATSANHKGVYLRGKPTATEISPLPEETEQTIEVG